MQAAPTAPRVTADRALPDDLPAAFSWLRDLPFYQAGLQGYSDAAMRIVARRHGCPYCVTEALLDMPLIRGGKGREAARLDGEDHPIAGQLMGSNPADMAAGAEVLVELGYDVVDVNLACPVKRIRKHSRGGHLLAEPDEAVAILRSVRRAIGDAVPLTVKLRRATDESDAAADDFRRIFDAVVDEGYFAATVHARTVRQRYDGPSRWEFLRDLVDRHAGFPIFGSGDILTAASVFDMIAATGVLAVSVARGAIGNPWIFRQAHQLLAGHDPTEPTLDEQRAVLGAQFELMHRPGPTAPGPAMAQRRMRKLGIRLSPYHPTPDEARDAFVRVRTLEDWTAAFERLYPPPVD